MYEALAMVNILSNIVEQGFRVVKFRLYGNSDIRTASQLAPFGDDANPIPGMRAVFGKTSRLGETVLLGYFNKSLLAGAGEKRIYSVDEDGDVATFVWLKSDGKIQLGGTADNAVAYTDLNTSLQNFKNLVNAELTKIQAGLIGVGGAYAKVDTTIDITASKIENIQTP